jgi:hypothetical protein
MIFDHFGKIRSAEINGAPLVQICAKNFTLEHRTGLLVMVGDIDRDTADLEAVSAPQLAPKVSRTSRRPGKISETSDADIDVRTRTYHLLALFTQRRPTSGLPEL